LRMAAPRRRPRWDWRQSWGVSWIVALVGCFFAIFSVGRASGFPLVGLVLGRYLCGHGEQRVLVAAPRFALYVARNKHPLLAFWGWNLRLVLVPLT